MAAQTIAAPAAVPSRRDLAALNGDVEDVLSRMHLDEDEQTYLEAVTATLDWVLGNKGAAEPHLPVEKCEDCDGRGGWGDDYRDVECMACDGAGWVRP